MPDIVNPEVIEELLSLSEDGDPELVIDLITMFLEDAPSKVAAIETGLTEQDFEKVERAAHSLKGSAGNLGASFLQEDCEALQNAGRQHELDVISSRMTRFKKHYAEAADALESIRRRYTD